MPAARPRRHRLPRSGAHRGCGRDTRHRPRPHALRHQQRVARAGRSGPASARAGFRRRTRRRRHQRAKRGAPAGSPIAPGAAVLIVGTERWPPRSATSASTRFGSAPTTPVAVVQGHSPQTGWADLAEAALAIRGGALWVAANVDLTLPSERGLLPGNGSMVAALRAATDQRAPGRGQARADAAERCVGPRHVLARRWSSGPARHRHRRSERRRSAEPDGAHRRQHRRRTWSARRRGSGPTTSRRSALALRPRGQPSRRAASRLGASTSARRR